LAILWFVLFDGSDAGPWQNYGLYYMMEVMLGLGNALMEVMLGLNNTMVCIIYVIFIFISYFSNCNKVF
jgi:hypothetical protein